jgi:hypothetical protein
MADSTARERRLDQILRELAQTFAGKAQDARPILQHWLDQGLDNASLHQKVLRAWFSPPSRPPAVRPEASTRRFSRWRR